MEPLGRLLKLYIHYLSALASTHLDRRLRRRMNPSDLVQEALLAAHRDFNAFRGGTEREWVAWLRQILIHCLHRAVEVHLHAERRDVRREVSLEPIRADVERSAARLNTIAGTRDPSPSAAAQAHERAMALAGMLGKLPHHYREIIDLRNIQGLPFAVIAERTDRTPTAARMLWLRAMDKLRISCEEEAGE